MVEIRPFKGVLYNQKKVFLSKVIAPPYDVISKKDQDRFYKLDPHNVIRLILGKIYPKDNKNCNRYKRAGRFYTKWIKEKILLLDAIPSIYISRIDFREGRKEKTRIGFIALISLQGDDNRLIPHERTFPGPKRDRLELIRACHANFSQIFTLYSDPEKRITKLLKPFMRKRPLIRARYNGEGHLIWKVRPGNVIEKIKRLMRNKDIFIADGHHRYEVARAFSHPFTMLYFSNMDEEGLSIFATHRLVRKGVIDRDRLEGLSDFFKVVSKRSLGDAEECLKKNRHAFGLLAKGEKGVKIFILKDASFIRRFIKASFSHAKKNLSVTILDEGVLKGFLGIKNFEKDISYTSAIREAKKKIDQGHFSYAFLLNPVSLYELKAIVNGGERMPHKSTYFYPKLLSGLITYDQERSLS